jgi:hypothetical protein
MALQDELVYEKREAAGRVAPSECLPELRLAHHAGNALQTHRFDFSSKGKVSPLR